MSIDRRRFLTISAASLSVRCLAACDANPDSAAEAPRARGARSNQVLEEGCSATIAMDQRAGVGAVGGQRFSEVLHLEDGADVGSGGSRCLAARGLGCGAHAALAHARRPDEAAAHHAEGRSLLRRGLECARHVDRRARERPRACCRQATDDAHYVDFQSFDEDYHESWDMASAMHPQTLVAYGMDGHLLAPAHGAPARLHSPVKLGYKNTKYLTQGRVHAEAERRLLERPGLRVVRRHLMSAIGVPCGFARSSNQSRRRESRLARSCHRPVRDPHRGRCSPTSIAAPTSISSTPRCRRRSRGRGYAAALAAAALDHRASRRNEGHSHLSVRDDLPRAPSGVRGSRRAALSASVPLARSGAAP